MKKQGIFFAARFFSNPEETPLDHEIKCSRNGLNVSQKQSRKSLIRDSSYP
jgi:hypothetical protein